ncbi:MAG: hypothetical protein AAGA90_12170 [Actinomycetota bacterium]
MAKHNRRQPDPSPPDDGPFVGEIAVRALEISGLLLVAAFPVMLALGRWFWGVDEPDQLFGAIGGGWGAVGGPLLLAGLDTRRRLRRGRETSFDPRRLNRAMRLGAGALVGFLALGILGVLVAVPLVLASAASFALAWVRPRPEDTTLTGMVGATIPVLLFIGGLNIDERPVVGALLFAAALSGGIRLYLLRRVARSS